MGTRQKFTPYNYQTLLLGNQLQVLEPATVILNNDGVKVPTAPPSNLMWHTVIDLYGSLRNGISQVRLDNPYDDTVIMEQFLITQLMIDFYCLLLTLIRLHKTHYCHQLMQLLILKQKVQKL